MIPTKFSAPSSLRYFAGAPAVLTSISKEEVL